MNAFHPPAAGSREVPTGEAALAEALRTDGRVDGSALATARRLTAERGGTLTDVLLAEGLAAPEDIAAAEAALAGVPVADLDRHPPAAATRGVLPVAVCQGLSCVPWRGGPGTLTIALADLRDRTEVLRRLGHRSERITVRSPSAAPSGAPSPAGSR
ncbi:MAG: hypothetical protein AAFW69_05010 [Pseudomonadota bacterium]